MTEDIEFLGPQQRLRKSEVIKVIEEALSSLGYNEVASLLELRSGVKQYDSVFFLYVQEGQWAKALEVLPSVTQSYEIERKAAFLIFRQKFLEAILHEDTAFALRCLRLDLTPFAEFRREAADLAEYVLRPPMDIISFLSGLGGRPSGASAANEQGLLDGGRGSTSADPSSLGSALSSVFVPSATSSAFPVPTKEYGNTASLLNGNSTKSGKPHFIATAGLQAGSVSPTAPVRAAKGVPAAVAEKAIVNGRQHLLQELGSVLGTPLAVPPRHLEALLEAGAAAARGDVQQPATVLPRLGRVSVLEDLLRRQDEPPRQPCLCLARLEGHTNEVWHAAFSEDGTMLATASKDETAIIWSISYHDVPAFRGPPTTKTFGPPPNVRVVDARNCLLEDDSPRSSSPTGTAFIRFRPSSSPSYTLNYLQDRFGGRFRRRTSRSRSSSPSSSPSQSPTVVAGLLGEQDSDSGASEDDPRAHFRNVAALHRLQASGGRPDLSQRTLFRLFNLRPDGEEGSSEENDEDDEDNDDDDDDENGDDDDDDDEDAEEEDSDDVAEEGVSVDEGVMDHDEEDEEVEEEVEVEIDNDETGVEGLDDGDNNDGEVDEEELARQEGRASEDSDVLMQVADDASEFTVMNGHAGTYDASLGGSGSGEGHGRSSTEATAVDMEGVSITMSAGGESNFESLITEPAAGNGLAHQPRAGLRQDQGRECGADTGTATALHADATISETISEASVRLTTPGGITLTSEGLEDVALSFHTVPGVEATALSPVDTADFGAEVGGIGETAADRDTVLIPEPASSPLPITLSSYILDGEMHLTESSASASAPVASLLPRPVNPASGGGRRRRSPSDASTATAGQSRSRQVRRRSRQPESPVELRSEDTSPPVTSASLPPAEDSHFAGATEGAPMRMTSSPDRSLVQDGMPQPVSLQRTPFSRVEFSESRPLLERIADDSDVGDGLSHPSPSPSLSPSSPSSSLLQGGPVSNESSDAMAAEPDLPTDDHLVVPSHDTGVPGRTGMSRAQPGAPRSPHRAPGEEQFLSPDQLPGARRFVDGSFNIGIDTEAGDRGSQMDLDFGVAWYDGDSSTQSWKQHDLRDNGASRFSKIGHNPCVPSFLREPSAESRCHARTSLPPPPFPPTAAEKDIITSGVDGNAVGHDHGDQPLSTGHGGLYHPVSLPPINVLRRPSTSGAERISTSAQISVSQTPCRASMPQRTSPFWWRNGGVRRLSNQPGLALDLDIPLGHPHSAPAGSSNSSFTDGPVHPGPLHASSHNGSNGHAIGGFPSLVAADLRPGTSSYNSRSSGRPSRRRSVPGGRGQEPSCLETLVSTIDSTKEEVNINVTMSAASTNRDPGGVFIKPFPYERPRRSNGAKCSRDGGSFALEEDMDVDANVGASRGSGHGLASQSRQSGAGVTGARGHGCSTPPPLLPGMLRVPRFRALVVLEEHGGPLLGARWSLGTTRPQLLITFTEWAAYVWEMPAVRLLGRIRFDREVQDVFWLPEAQFQEDVPTGAPGEARPQGPFFGALYCCRLRIYNVQGECQRDIQPNFRPSAIIPSSSGGAMVLLWSDRLAVSSSADVNKLRAAMPISSVVLSVTLSRDDRTLLATLDDGTGRLYDLRDLLTNLSHGSLLDARNSEAEEVRPEAQPTPEAAPELPPGYGSATALIWSPFAAAPDSRRRTLHEGCFAGPADELVVMGNEKGEISVFRRDDPAASASPLAPAPAARLPLLRFPAHPLLVNSVTRSRAAPLLLVSASDDPTVCIWALDGGLDAPGAVWPQA